MVFVFDFILDCDALSSLMIINQVQDCKGIKEKPIVATRPGPPSVLAVPDVM